MRLIRNLLICGVLSLFLLPATASAQVVVSLGAGIVSSTFTGDDVDDDDVDSRTGFSFGGWFAVPLGGRLSLVPGAAYVQKGATDNVSGGDAEISIDYLEIPVLLSVRLTPMDSNFAFSVFGGPSVAFEMGCDVEGTVDGVSVSVSCDEFDDEPESIDFGAAFGVNGSIPASDRVSLWGSAGVDFGLKSIDSSAAEDDVKNQAFFFSVGLAFPVGN